MIFSGDAEIHIHLLGKRSFTQHDLVFSGTERISNTRKNTEILQSSLYRKSNKNKFTKANANE